MNVRLLCCLILGLGLSRPAAAARDATGRWETSVVTLEVNRRQHDFQQPWLRRPITSVKTGVVLGPGELLTTAEGLADHTVIRAQRQGRGTWFEARVTWVDYPANLALLGVGDAAFWRGLKPVQLSAEAQRDGNLQVLRWRGGNLEVRRTEFTRFTVSNPNVGEAAHVLQELNSEIEGVGWGEPVVAGSRVAGLVFAQVGNTLQVLPTPYIRALLEARRKETFRGLGYFDFTWQPAENPETLRYLRLPETSQGVVVIEVPPRPGRSPSPLRPRDVLLQIDGFAVDVQGDYEDPLYGHLMLEGLATRGKWAGESLRLKVWRNGGAIDIDYVLPRIEDAAKLVPEAPYSHPPEYLIAGGLLFQPLTRNYLRTWGQAWERSAPFRLAFYRNEEATPERPALIVLSRVLPDPFNLGYQDSRALVLEKVNGRQVSRLDELQRALSQPVDGYHRLEFSRGETLQRMVLNAPELDAATQRTLERYGIERAAEIQPRSP